MEGLSILILKARLDGRLSGIKKFDAIYITHLLFVDDVLLMEKGTIA